MTEPSPYRLLVTGGPTHEPIDAVRYIGNRSSGRLGTALATAAARRAIDTTLLLGPTAVTASDGTNLSVHRFRTTADLQEHLHRLWPEHDVLIMAAAVADYRPLQTTDAKMPRTSEDLYIHMEPTPDLVAELATASRPDQRLIGFALESKVDLEQRALAKLARKRVHAIVANPLETMESESVEARVFLRDGSTRDPGGILDKAAFAEWLLDFVDEIRAMPPRSS